MYSKFIQVCTIVSTCLISVGCTTTSSPYDYTNYRANQPTSILILPPTNSSPDVEATYSVLSQTTFPVAESGYYVIPVTLMNETFKQNGLTVPEEIHAVAPVKLREFFGADAALYIDISQYGTSYQVITSDTRVTASAKLIDLKTGLLLWEGKATASSQENRNSSGGGLAGLLVQAVVSQIVESTTNMAHTVSARTTYRLLSADQPNKLLPGPRSSKYGQSSANP